MVQKQKTLRVFKKAPAHKDWPYRETSKQTNKKGQVTRNSKNVKKGPYMQIDLAGYVAQWQIDSLACLRL